MSTLVDKPVEVNYTTIIDVVRNSTLFMHIRAKERDNLHKIWLFGFIISQTALIILVLLVVRLSKYKSLKKYLPAPKF